MLVNEYSTRYMERGKFHRELKSIGNANDESSVSSRLVILDKIKVYADRMEVLFSSFDAWEKEKQPIDVKKLWPDPEEPKAAGIDPELTIEELKTLKKNLQSSIVKDKNLLLYSSKTKPPSGKEKSMPEGPKRIILEKRVAKKEKEIYDLDMQIAKLS